MEREMPHHASFIPPDRETPRSLQEEAMLESEDILRNAYEIMKQSRALLALADEILARR
jgi:hypothetical protein